MSTQTVSASSGSTLAEEYRDDYFRGLGASKVAPFMASGSKPAKAADIEAVAVAHGDPHGGPAPWRRRVNSSCKTFCCCPCLPKWARYLCWGIIGAFIIVLIVLLSLVATLKMPTIEFSGIAAGDTHVTTNLAAGNLSAEIGLQVNITNTNLFDIRLSNINAYVYYPQLTAPIGTGHLDSYLVPKHSDTTFVFPFQAAFSTSNPNDMFLLNDAATLCGLTGSSASSVEVNYTIKLAATVYIFTIYPTITSSISVPCSAQMVTQLINGLGGKSLESLASSF